VNPERKVILLVEDDAVTCLAGKVMLERNGYSVMTAISGARAIEIALNNKIDLIIMDIDLGGEIDGNKAAQEILSKKNLPVLFLTAHIEREMVEKVRKVTRYGYALKNTGEYVLLSSIEMVFELFEAHEKTRESEENYRSLVEDINDVIFSMDEKGLFSYISPRVERFTEFKPEEIIGKSFHDFILQEDISSSSDQFEVLAAGGSFFEEFKWTKKNGDVVWFRSSISPVYDKGEFRGFKGLLTDITFRKKSEEQMKILLQEKEKLLRELNCLYKISGIMEGSSGSLDHVLASIVLLIPEALSYPDCSFAVISYAGKEYVSSYPAKPDSVMERELVIGGNITGLVTIGYISTPDNCSRALFDDKDKDFFDTVTERIEKTIELFIARDELRKLEREVIDISERERQKIGHELHDSLGQILTGVSFMLKTLKNQLDGSSPAVIGRVSEISDLVRDATQVCRQITRGLPIVTIQHNTLILALDQLAISTRDIFNINCELEFYGPVEVGDDFVSSQLFRITQEAVNNAVKHSGAKNIYITLKNSSGINLSVRDDGCGNDLFKKDQGMGLSIMKYRADLINGEFSAESNENCGFTVTVKIP
jgi:PAS domain S-box-containing protein